MDFVSYLEGLAPAAVGQLYDSPWTCRAVVRNIPPLAQAYVLRLLFLDEPVSQSAGLLQLPAACAWHACTFAV